MDDTAHTPKQLQERIKELESQLALCRERESRLAESERNARMFRAMTESTRAMVLIASIKENRAVYANPAAARLTGFSIEELTATPPPNLFSPESTAEAMRQREAFMRGEDVPALSTFELITKSGEKRIVENTWAVMDLEEEGLHKVTVTVDVTEKKKAEDRLAESEKKFRTIFETTGTGTMLFGDDTIITLTNDEWAKMVGYTREEIEGKMSWADFFTEESLEIMREYHKQRGIDPTSVPRKYESDVLTRGKQVLNALVTIDMVPGSQKRVASIQDLTPIKKTQKDLADSEQRYRTIFETTGTGTIIFGDDKIIRLANAEWAAMVGYERGEIEGKLPWSQFFTDASLEKMMTYHAKRTDDPSSAPRVYEADLKDRQGKIHNGYITIAMVPGTDQRVGSFSDLTELKRAQRQMYQADKMAALGQIIAGVAHEINNPNNFIYFNLPILRKYLDGMRPFLDAQLANDPNATILGMPYQVFLEDSYKLLDNMEHGSARITSIVSDLKNYVRADSSEQMIEAELSLIVKQVMTLVGKQVRKMVKRFDVEIPDSLPLVNVNAGKIEQVLINLLVNAGQAADKEEAWVKLSLRAADDNAVEIIVADNGAGIPASIQDQVFEPFFTSKGRDAGTGLGLSISHKIIEDHGGTIQLESVEGEGTTFTVRLPAG